jgi:hypothetical protein
MYLLNKDKLKNIDISKVTLGSDPEFFIFDSKKSEFIASCGWIGGTKKAPVYLESKLGYQEDNVALEFNVPPTVSSKDLMNNVGKLISYIETKYNFKEKGYEIVPVASAYFTSEQLNSEQAQTFGCDPDYNAWSNSVNEINIINTSLRSCGGHVHVGYENPNVDSNLQIIRLLDLYLGVPSVLLDLDTDRKQLYGKAGAFRHQPYGVEFRTLSNFWLSSQHLADWVFNNVFIALDKFNLGFEFDADTAALIQNCINQNDTIRANYIIEKFSIPMPEHKEEKVTI